MSARRWTLTALAVLVVLAGIIVRWVMVPGPLAFAGSGASATPYSGMDPTGVPVQLQQADQVTRGRYLTAAADCEACHTTDGGTPYAGGRAFTTPFGTIYSPNITADRASGIGTWSEEDFTRAVRQGIRPDGVRLYPAFPYAAYTYLSDEDVHAIRAYLMSLPGVANVTPATELSFPYNQRWLMGVWGLLYNPDTRFRPHGDRSAQWNRGAYLAEALAHCGDCHTPRTALQALNNRHKFAGAVTAGWRAYNITADPAAGVGAWSDAQLAQYLAAGHAAERGTAGGPMAEAVTLSLSHLAPQDIAALVAYLRSVPAQASPGLPELRTLTAATDPAQPPGHDRLGQHVYEGACAGCHGWTGTSVLGSRASLTGTRAINDPTALNVAQMILNGSGLPHADGAAAMPAFATAYSDAEIAAVANYVTGRFGARASNITAQDVARLRGTG